MIDLKVLIGVHSWESHDLPRMDKATVKAAVKVVNDSECTLRRVMSTEDWYWWRVAEHIQEVDHPTQTVRDWMKLDPSDEDEPRIIETCEALRQNVGGPCPEQTGGDQQCLQLCKGVSLPFLQLMEYT